MKIAIPSIWFHRGQTVVSQTLARALRELRHEVFIHARMGAVYGVEKQERGRWGWNDPGITYWPTYDLKATMRLKVEPCLVVEKKFVGSLRGQGIDLVLFNEEYDWELVAAIKREGFRVATYLDYLDRDWSQDTLRLYDRILCSTHRAYDLMPEENRHYIGWGIPEDTVICPGPIWPRPYLFYLNAGWLGINDRKGLQTLLECYQILLKSYPELYGSLLVQAQVGIDFEQSKALTRGADFMVGEMNRPGLYHMAEVYCYPAILDGLGLSLLEAIAAGCAVICPDAAPWNEFVAHEKNGLLVPIANQREREDGIAFPEVFVDKEAWVTAMERMLGSMSASYSDEPLRRELAMRNGFGGYYGVGAGRLAWTDFKGRIAESLEGMA